MLADINPDASSMSTFMLEPLGDNFVFLAENQWSKKQIWVTDGSSDGTSQITDIRGQDFPRVRNLVEFDDRIFFNADDGESGQELWVTDGTEEGTYMYADLQEGSGSGTVLNILTTNDQLFFYAYNASDRNLYHMTNGEEAPSIVKDIWPGQYDDVQYLVAVGDEVYFRANDEEGFGQGNDIWKSDGTEEGTVKVIDWGSSAANPEGFFGTDERVYFQMEEYGTSSQWGIYTSDGNEEGTIQLAQHNFSSNGSASFQFIEINDGIIYLPSDGTGREPHFANADGAQLIRSIFPGTGSPFIINMIDHEGIIYFIADDGSGGDELWRTDATFEGTYQVLDLAPGESRGRLNKRDLVRFSTATIGKVNGGMLFGGQTGDEDYELFFSDGTEEGTSLIANINPNGPSYPHNFYQGENYTYFTADDGLNGFELLRSNGTTEGTTLVGNIAAGASSSIPEDFMEKDGFLYFTAYSQTLSRELYRVDKRCIVPEIAISSTLICLEEEISFDASIISIDGSLDTVEWTFGDDTNSDVLSTTHTYIAQGNFPVELNLVTNEGCSYSESFTIAVLETPVAFIQEELEPLCLSSTWEPENLSSPSISYIWDFGAAGTSEENLPIVEFPEEGEYICSLEIDNGACTASTEITVNVYTPTLELVSTTPPNCPGDLTGEIEVLGSSSQGEMTFSSDNEIFTSSTVFNELGIGLQTIYAQDSDGCSIQLEVDLEGPEEFILTTNTTNDDGSGIGSITIEVEGGTAPYEFILNGELSNEIGLFENLR